MRKTQNGGMRYEYVEVDAWKRFTGYGDAFGGVKATLRGRQIDFDLIFLPLTT